MKSIPEMYRRVDVATRTKFVSERNTKGIRTKEVTRSAFWKLLFESPIEDDEK